MGGGSSFSLAVDEMESEVDIFKIQVSNPPRTTPLPHGNHIMLAIGSAIQPMWFRPSHRLSLNPDSFLVCDKGSSPVWGRLPLCWGWMCGW